MYSGKLIVLKFGGSVLGGPDDLFLAAQEVYRWYRQGYRVVAIVSALQGRTDELFERAESTGSEAAPHNVARLVSGGERESAALLALTLDECGVPNSVLFEGEINLLTCGDPLDATPHSIDTSFVHKALLQHPVLVVPGFVGRDRDGKVNLLGRGGSDLTAILVANHLKADRCRLIKDVTGLYEFDPNTTSKVTPGRFSSASWEKALELDGSILQHKAVQHARENGVEFEVAACLGNQSTRVGKCQTELANDTDPDTPLRIGLLGFGTVGHGVYTQLNRLGNRFDFSGIAVRDVNRHSKRFVAPQLLTSKWKDIISSDCDVVVELMGGVGAARDAVLAALENGKHIVTANKALLARHGDEIAAARNAAGKRVRNSAAVGGCVPMLEAVRWCKNRGHEIFGLEGILNGTTNFVLDLVAGGTSLADAIANAQQKGLAEADPSGDLSGKDASEKLVLLAQLAGLDANIDDVSLVGVNDVPTHKLNNGMFRQVARIGADPKSASVQVRQVASDSAFAKTPRQNNLLLIQTPNGPLAVRGAGAGRWPTALAVVSDILDLESQIKADEKISELSTTAK